MTKSQCYAIDKDCQLYNRVNVAQKDPGAVSQFSTTVAYFLKFQKKQARCISIHKKTDNTHIDYTSDEIARDFSSMLKRMLDWTLNNVFLSLLLDTSKTISRRRGWNDMIRNRRMDGSEI